MLEREKYRGLLGTGWMGGRDQCGIGEGMGRCGDRERDGVDAGQGAGWRRCGMEGEVEALRGRERIGVVAGQSPTGQKRDGVPCYNNASMMPAVMRRKLIRMLI